MNMTYASQERLPRIQQAPSQLFAARAVAARCALLAGGAFKYDVPGALAARQDGAAYMAARAGLQLGLVAFLVTEGGACLSLEVDLSRAAGYFADSVLGLAHVKGVAAIQQEASALECANPVTSAEVRAYALRCTTFVEETLRLAENQAYQATCDSAAMEQYMRERCELKIVLDHLGVVGLTRSGPLERLQWHREVVRRLTVLLQRA